MTIVDDMVNELEELFDITLERTPGLDSRITLHPDDGRIVISDNDGKYNLVTCTLVCNLQMVPLIHSHQIFIQSCFLYHLPLQWLWWVWRQHSIVCWRMWVWWRCVLSYIIPTFLVPLHSPLASTSQLVIILQVCNILVDDIIL